MGSLGSAAAETLDSEVRVSSSDCCRKFFGARNRRSASFAISKARCRARSDSPPKALACNLHAIRRNRNCLWLDRLSSPKTSKYFYLSRPTVSRRRPSISSCNVVVLLVSSLMPLTRSHMSRSLSPESQVVLAAPETGGADGRWRED